MYAPGMICRNPTIEGMVLTLAKSPSKAEQAAAVAAAVASTGVGPGSASLFYASLPALPANPPSMKHMPRTDYDMQMKRSPGPVLSQPTPIKRLFTSAASNSGNRTQHRITQYFPVVPMSDVDVIDLGD